MNGLWVQAGRTREQTKGQWVAPRGLASLLIVLCLVKLNETARWMVAGRRSNELLPTDWIQLFCLWELSDVLHSGRQRRRHQTWNLRYSCESVESLLIWNLLWIVADFPHLRLFLHPQTAPTVSRSSVRGFTVCRLEWKCEYDSPGMDRYHLFYRTSRVRVLAFW